MRIACNTLLAYLILLLPRAFCFESRGSFGRKLSILKAIPKTERTLRRPRPGSSDSPTPKVTVDGATPRFFAVKALMPAKGTVAFAVDRLESSLNYGKLSDMDRSFARLLVTTVERRLGQINAVLAACQTKAAPETPRRRPAKSDQFVESVLRVGAAQLLFLHTSEHAAVKETVDVLRMSKDIVVTEAKLKYVNAVLRRISREGPQLLATVTSETANVAPWLVDEWIRTWGPEATHRIIASAMAESPRCLTVRLQSTATLSASEQIQEVCALFPEAHVLPQGSIRVSKAPRGSISTWPLYQEGTWWCQDPSATIPALALSQASSQRGTVSLADQHVVDLCAAPGGKTAQLSNFGFGHVTAVEVSLNRINRLEQNMKRLQMQWDIVVADGSQWQPKTLVDAVLVDVPCTATGTGSKRPDVLRRDSNYAELLQVQQALARHAADAIVKVGGYLVYATCSLLKQESEDQVVELLSRSSRDGKMVAQLQTVPFEKGEIPGFDGAIDENGWIRVLPGMLEGSLGQCDGFFVARLQRIA